VDRRMEYVAGYGVGIDLTLRDVQEGTEEKGVAVGDRKGIRHLLPTLRLRGGIQCGGPAELQIRLTVNGGDPAGWKHLDDDPSYPRHHQAYMSGRFTLEPGDVILTGTPAGVSRIVTGGSSGRGIPGSGHPPCGGGVIRETPFSP